MDLTDSQLSSIEIGRRQLAKRGMWDFVKYVDPRFTEAIPHAKFICKELNEVVRFIETGEGTQILVLTVPPRHLKTTLVADHLPSYFLGRNPEKKVIDTTYTQSLALDSSKRVREMIHVTENYKNLFGERATTLVDENFNPLPAVDLRRDTRAMDRWMIDKYGGTFQAVGFQGIVTGRGGHLIIVDDPHASRKEAESQVERANVWQFFISTLWTRLEKNGAIAVIMQRWHEDDLVGKLKRVKDPESEEYIEGFPTIRFLNLPALAELDDLIGRKEGEALWPAFKDEHKLRQDQAVMGDYYFNSQYQQRATAPSGNIFKRYWFRVSPMFPLDYRIQYWDTADGEGEDNDYWACATVGVGKFGILLEDMFREKMTPAQGIEEIQRRYDMFSSEDHPISVVWVEAKSSGKSCVSIIQAGDSDIPIDEHVPKGDKVLRAGTITTTCKNRRVFLRQHTPWISAFLEEITSFPMGVNDDQVDCFVGAVSKIVHGGYMQTGPRVKREEKRTGSDRIGKDYREEVFKKKRKSQLRKPPT